jgi:exodeoxyribonuclease VII small subunit
MTTEPEPAVTFEEALKQLESIVDDLERGEPELSAALAKYERGVGLLARCQGVLEQAERSVALLSGVDAAGNPITTPFPDETSADPEPPPPAKPAAKTRKRPAKPAADEGDEPFIPF